MTKYLSQIARKNLKRIVKSFKYKSQEEFAYAFRAKIRTVSRWFNNGIKNLDTLQEIADFLKIDVLSLLKDE